MHFLVYIFTTALFLFGNVLLALDSFDPDCEPFITTWQTDNISTGSTNSTSITIPTSGLGYNYDVDWDNNGTYDSIGMTGSVTHDFGAVGTYTIRIRGDFPRIYFNNAGDKDKLLSVDQWGDIAWSSMSSAFQGCSNLTIPATDAPDLTLVTNMASMFSGAASFNQDVSTWVVDNVTNMSSMFLGASSFNQDLSTWKVNNVEFIFFMFRHASSFNGDLSTWKLTSATDLTSMFVGATSFNQDLSMWEVNNITKMKSMFEGATSFDQDLSNWKVDNVTDMSNMFASASAFNQDISSWKVGSVEKMSAMFRDATSFDQDLSDWNITAVTNMSNMLDRSGVSPFNYDNLLKGWATQAVQMNNNLGVATLQYCTGASARSTLTGTYKWNIMGDGIDCDSNAFITTWKTDNMSTGSSCTTCITIPASGSGYDYDVDWDNDGDYDEMGITGSKTHNFGTVGTYQIGIRGDFPRIRFANTGDKEKILSVDQWGDIYWQTMAQAFRGCSNLTILASDGPNLSAVTDMSDMFYDADAFDQDISHWDVSNVETMSSLFRNADLFNQDLTDWNVASVRDMSLMFYEAKSFDSSLGWSAKTAQVEDMSSMFFNADAFNQDLSTWIVSSVTNMSSMFANTDRFDSPLNWGATTSNVSNMSEMFSGAQKFNQDISNWDVSGALDMSYMFSSAILFNSPLSWGANTSNVTNMSGMFASANAFNQDISGWDVSAVVDASYMFNNAISFDSPLDWGATTNSMMDVTAMFRFTDLFNQDLSAWDVSSVTTMELMFFDATSFDRDLGDWDITNVSDMTDMLDLSGLSIYNYDQTLMSWAEKQVKSNVNLGANQLYYCQAESAHDKLENMFGWNIMDDNIDNGPSIWSEGGNRNWNDDTDLWWNNRFPSLCSEVILHSDSNITLKNNKVGYGGTLEVKRRASLVVESGGVLEISN